VIVAFQQRIGGTLDHGGPTPCRAIASRRRDSLLALVLPLSAQSAEVFYGDVDAEST
jgi:hypothetical protein